ncbi:GatB/YqeY domain-containing protein [Candidatus Microgenomates bacterium]|nr:GatB/YqeY domain-containing protein [Candidatus Microgenomates bacterium]
MAAFIDKIRQDLNQALKNKEGIRTSTLRLLLSALQNEKIAKGHDLSEEETIVILRREVKLRQEAIEAYTKGGRAELAQKEEDEKKILEAFLPASLSEEEIRKAVGEIKSTGITDFGKLMGQAMAKLRGQADGSVVSRIVKEELGK